MLEYGITTSKAHVWVHVCPIDAAIYYYSRKRMIAILQQLHEVTIKSAIGRLVKLHGNRVCDGGFIRDIDPPRKWWDDYDWHGAKTDTEVGEFAENLFARCVAEFLFQIPATHKRYDDRSDQFEGKDFCLTPMFAPMDVEVKADIAGGEWGTGNLFVQTHEYRHDHNGRNTHRGLGTPSH